MENPQVENVYLRPTIFILSICFISVVQINLSAAADFIFPGAEDRSAPQHNQIQPFSGRQPDPHLIVQQVPLPDAGRALLAHCSLEASRGANQSLVHHSEAQARHQLVS